MDARPHRRDRRHRHLASMEPRLFSHGYSDQLPVEQFTTQDLQWSHGLSAMDNIIRPDIAVEDNLLQRSHGLSAMDTPIPDSLCIMPVLPSMEPRLFSHGHSGKRRATGARRNPLQRSHGLSAMDTRVSVSLSASSNGLQRSHGSSAMDTSYYAAGNGTADDPSKEPRLLSHGYCRNRPALAGCAASFKGATAFQPWIRVLCAVDAGADVLVPSMEPRLFSHGYMATVQNQHIARDPSMEPRLFSHGYPRWPVARATRLESLQWSHGFSAMDTRCTPDSRWATGPSFNGATAFQPWILEPTDSARH